MPSANTPRHARAATKGVNLDGYDSGFQPTELDRFCWRVANHLRGTRLLCERLAEQQIMGAGASAAGMPIEERRELYSVSARSSPARPCD